MSQIELTIITQTHELRVWTLDRVARFPRSHRFELGRRLLDKAEILHQAALRVEELRWAFRAATDLRTLSLKNQGHAIDRLHAIGRQLGAWRNSLQRRS